MAYYDWAWLTVNYLIAYKVLPTACRIYLYQKSTTLAYVLEVIVMIHSPYAQVTFVNAFYTPMFRPISLSLIIE